MKRSESMPRSIAETAGNWFLRRRDGLTRAEQRDFEVWLTADPRHGVALEDFARTWQELRQPHERGIADLALQRLAQRRRVRSRRRSTAIAVAGIAVVAGFLFARLPRHNGLDEMPSSVAVRPDRQTLPDGSTVEVNAGGYYEVNFTPGERGIRLLRGEALFSVTKDPSRPFVVSAGAVSVRAVGTAFSVRHAAATVDVLVTEGCVAVEKKGPVPPPTAGERKPAPPALVDAGRRITIPLSTAPAATPADSVPVTAADIRDSLAWRSKRIEFTETPLSEVLRLFNRQNRLQLRTADSATAQLEVSGVFWADDAETFVRLIETALALRAERSGDEVTLSRN